MENKDNLMKQLIFKFPFKTKYFEHDFYVSSSNFSAYKLIESWPNWTGKWLNVFGASGSGKTHLSKILAKKIERVSIIDESNISDKILELFKKFRLSFKISKFLFRECLMDWLF